MITEGEGSIFDSGCEALVNPVNCVGVAGKGLALQFKKKFPSSYKAYRKACLRGQLAVGRVFVDAVDSPLTKSIFYVPTKVHWLDNSEEEFIRDGLKVLVGAALEVEPKSVAVPALGCGLGGLEWERVKPMMEEAFAEVGSVDWVIYGPKEQNVGTMIFSR